MEWIPLNSISQLEALDQGSAIQDVFIFKHSTQCSISERAFEHLYAHKDEQQPFCIYYLDLLRYRDVSNAVEDRYEVLHESPQVLLIRAGKCVYHVSHRKIDFNEMTTQVNQRH